MRNRLFHIAANYSTSSTSSISSRLQKAGYSQGLWWDLTDFAITIGFGAYAIKHIIEDCKMKRMTKAETESQNRAQLATSKQNAKDEVIKKLAAQKLAEIQKAAINGCNAATPPIRSLQRHC